MLEKLVQDGHQWFERVIAQFHVVVVQSLGRFPSNILKLRQHQVGTFQSYSLTSSSTLSAEKVKSPPERPVGGLSQSHSRRCCFGQSRVQSTTEFTLAMSSIRCGSSLLRAIGCTSRYSTSPRIVGTVRRLSTSNHCHRSQRQG